MPGGPQRPWIVRQRRMRRERGRRELARAADVTRLSRWKVDGHSSVPRAAHGGVLSPRPGSMLQITTWDPGAQSTQTDTCQEGCQTASVRRQATDGQKHFSWDPSGTPGNGKLGIVPCHRPEVAQGQAQANKGEGRSEKRGGQLTYACGLGERATVSTASGL